MPSTEVKRTLVKSPPELWAELSDPAGLSRHLGEFGEIRVTRVEPEKTVEWEAHAARGSVRISQSGWGTKVTLSIVRDAPEPEPRPAAEPAAPEPEPEPEPIAHDPPAAQSEPQADSPEPTAAEPETQAAEPETQAAEPETQAAEPETQAAEPEPEQAIEPEAAPHIGFFRRLFRRRRAQLTAPGPTSQEPEPALEPAPTPEFESLIAAEPEPESLLPAEPTPDPDPEPPCAAELEHEKSGMSEPMREPALTAEPAPDSTPDLAAELAGVEAAIVQRDTALLTAVLDRLGAAHHRPFSRG